MWGAIASVGSSLIGGILGNRQAKKERRRAIADDLEKFSRIRASAEKAGFNPLTALGSAASGGFGSLPSGSIAPLASVELAQRAITGVVDNVSGEAARREKAQAVQDRLQRLKLERLEAGQAGAIAARTTGVVMNTSAARAVEPPLGVSVGMSNVRPQSRPTLQSAGSIPVFAPDGTQFSVPRRVADRLQLEPYAAVIAGDLPELVGEIPGEAANAAAALNINNAVGSPLWQKKWTPPAQPSTGSKSRRDSRN